MKIIYVATSILPSRAANSIHVMRMCDAFVQEGHVVTLVVPDHRSVEPGVDDVFSFYGVAKRFDIHRLPWWPMKGRAYVFGIGAAVLACRSHPDLVYGRSIHALFVAAQLGLTVIYDAHDPLSDKARPLTSWMHKRLLKSRHLAYITVNSVGLRDIYARRFGYPVSETVVAPNGADPGTEEVTETEQSPGTVRVGYVGHLYRGRGLELILDLAQACPWAEFHIIGGSAPDVTYWRNRAATEENVILHGFVPPSETAKFRAACDVLIAPYQHEVSVMGGGKNTVEWMSPVKLFEYMASGKPIISSDLPRIRDVLVHGETAWLCPPDDLATWIAALITLRDDPIRAAALARSARQTFESNYTWQARARKVIKRFETEICSEV